MKNKLLTKKYVSIILVLLMLVVFVVVLSSSYAFFTTTVKGKEFVIYTGNLKVDYILSSSQLEQFIKDNSTTAFPQSISTERPDKASNYLLLGRVIILVNGSPFSIILPASLVDFLTSPEDYNLNYHSIVTY